MPKYTTERAKDTNQIMVSVVCLTYNHEKYLRAALESVISQITNFSYEVIIGDDCSSDNSANIIREFEKKYPNIIKAVCREKNVGSSENERDLYSRTKGKYAILLETDDFWIDRKKLQKQVDFLESNPDYFEVAHRCVIVDEDGQPRGIQYSECHDSKYTLKHFAKGILPGQSTTCMFRNFYKQHYDYNFDLLLKKEYRVGPGDKRGAFVMASQAKVACLPDVMSAYRFVQSGGSSFSATKSSRSPLYKVDSAYNIVKYTHDCIPNNREALKCAERLLIRDVLFGILKREDGFSFSLLRDNLTKTAFPIRSAAYAIWFCLIASLKKIFKLNVSFKKIDVSNELNLLENHKKEMMALFGNQ